MPNVAAILRDEIKRLSRKEVRASIEPARRVSAQQRRVVTELKRQVAELARRIAQLERRGKASMPTPTTAPTARRRFVAKGLRSQRARLGLSAADYGRLLGVSSQTIYNWEQGATKPRSNQQLATLSTLRAIGKREARQRLMQLERGAKQNKRTSR